MGCDAWRCASAGHRAPYPGVTPLNAICGSLAGSMISVFYTKKPIFGNGNLHAPCWPAGDTSHQTDYSVERQGRNWQSTYGQASKIALKAVLLAWLHPRYRTTHPFPSISLDNLYC